MIAAGTLCEATFLILLSAPARAALIASHLCAARARPRGDAPQRRYLAHALRERVHFVAPLPREIQVDSEAQRLIRRPNTYTEPGFRPLGVFSAVTVSLQARSRNV